MRVYYENSRKPIHEEGFFPVKYSFGAFLKLFLQKKPDAAIYFIWLRYKFSLPFITFNRLFLRTKVIVWSKGINISGRKKRLMNSLYYFRQKIANALILYSEYEKQFIRTRLEKVFVANNTIDQNSFYLEDTGHDIKKELGIHTGKIVLFVGRIEERKNPNLLINLFAQEKLPYNLIIVGPGLSEKQQEIIQQSRNIFAVGGIYDQKHLSAFYQAANVFCIPGHIGLGVNEAFLFGIPVVTARIGDDPELISSEPLMLLCEGENCELFEKNSFQGLKEALTQTLDNENHLAELKKHAKQTFNEKARIEYMRDGFIAAINHTLQK